MREFASSTILNVHGDEAERRRRTALLRAAGFAVAEAASAREAVDRLKVLRPAILLATLPDAAANSGGLGAALKRDHPGVLCLSSGPAPPFADLALPDGAEDTAILSALALLLRLARAETEAADLRAEAGGVLTEDFVHDFNNHIMAITGNLELMLARPGDERLVRWAENALEAAQHASLLATARLAGPAAPGADAALTAPNGAAGSRRILIVDDEVHVRSYLTDLLLGIGYETVEADDGTSALAALNGRVPDLLIVDYAMPGMTGAELALRVLGRAPEARILFMTGHADSAALPSLDPDLPMIRKPFRSEDLIAAVREALA